jgi:hypothetical protein
LAISTRDWAIGATIARMARTSGVRAQRIVG